MTYISIVFPRIFIYLHSISNNWYIMTKLNRLKAVLAEQEKTGKWLAQELGKSNSTISKWCSNTIQPDLQTLDKIAHLLNVDRRDLLTPSK